MRIAGSRFSGQRLWLRKRRIRFRLTEAARIFNLRYTFGGGAHLKSGPNPPTACLRPGFSASCGHAIA
jgi:hypothetical protein